MYTYRWVLFIVYNNIEVSLIQSYPDRGFHYNNKYTSVYTYIILVSLSLSVCVCVCVCVSLVHLKIEENSRMLRTGDLGIPLNPVDR